MEFENLTRKRATIRKFSTKKPKVEDVIKIIDIANTSPSPGNLPILKYLIIEDKETIDKIAEACLQDFIKQSSILVIVLSNPEDAVRSYESRGKKYVKQHAGAAIQNFLLEVENMGLASCWVGAFSDVTIKNLLGIPDTIDIEAILPIGYKLVTDHTKQKRKPTLEGRIHFQKYGNPFRKPYPRIPT